MNSKRLPSPPHNPGVRDLVQSKREGSRSLIPEDIERGFRGWHESGYARRLLIIRSGSRIQQCCVRGRTHSDGKTGEHVWGKYLKDYRETDW